MPPIFAHYFEAKVGSGHLLEYLISLVHSPLYGSLQCYTRGLVTYHIIMMTAATFERTASSFTDCVLKESLSLVVPRSIKATCIVRGQPQVPSPCKQQKTGSDQQMRL